MQIKNLGDCDAIISFRPRSFKRAIYSYGIPVFAFIDGLTFERANMYWQFYYAKPNGDRRYLVNNTSSDRWKKLGIKIRPLNNKSNYVLSYSDKEEQELLKRKPDFDGTRFYRSTHPKHDHYRAWKFLIDSGYGELAVKAMTRGVPVYCLRKHNIAKKVSIDLETEEPPTDLLRRRLCYMAAYNQWNNDDFISGAFTYYTMPKIEEIVDKFYE